MINKDNMKRRAVAFNLDDPYQRKLYEYTLRFTNYSGHMKHLIQRDMEYENNKEVINNLHAQVRVKPITYQKVAPVVVNPNITETTDNHGAFTQEKPDLPKNNNKNLLEGLI